MPVCAQIPESATTRPVHGFSTNEPEAHVWWLRTDRLVESGSSVLSREEHARARRFRFERDRAVYTTTRTVLRYVVGHYAGYQPAALRFGVGPYGKPYLVAPTAPRLSFNVSHSGAHAIIAVTNGPRVGVDIERVRESFDWSDVAAHTFAASEATWLRRASSERRCAGFFACGS